MIKFRVEPLNFKDGSNKNNSQSLAYPILLFLFIILFFMNHILFFDKATANILFLKLKKFKGVIEYYLFSQTSTLPSVSGVE
jgi:hypothetical protein